MTLAETVLGKGLRQLPRDSFIVSTKCGRYGAETFDFSAKRVTASVDESMQRLGVDYIDIIQCHDIEYGDLDQVVTETIPALLRLKEAGKVRAIGITGYPLEIFPYVLSCCPPGCIDVALSYCNYTLQNDRLSMLMPWFKRAGVGLINASPLCMGLLTEGGGPEWHPADQETKEASRHANDICEAAGESLANVALKFSHLADASMVASTLVGIDSIETLNKNIDILEGNLESDQLIEDVINSFKPVRNRRWASGSFGV